MHYRVSFTKMNRFTHLLAPGSIGALRLRNRILMCPMGDSLADRDGTVSDTQVGYYEARAAGGAALLLVGSASVSYPVGSYSATQTSASRTTDIAGLARLASAVHAHGALIGAQLVHDGANSLYDIAQGHPLLVPSVPQRPRPDRISRIVTEHEISQMMSPFTGPDSKLEYKIATDSDLEEAINMYADAADRCMAAGFDAIELHGGHGYLLDAFRSGYSNTRDDRWGGALENRARLMIETIRAVRNRIGPSVPLWMRINAFELGRDGGETLEESLVLAPMLVEAGIDALHVSAYASTDLATGVTDSHTPHAPGNLVRYASEIKEAINVPVITFGRLDPEAAESVVANGQADFIAMGRKLLADPELPNKLRENRLDTVRPCIYQYRCIGNIFIGESVACVANPEVGHEAELAVTATANQRRVLVAGGGPAGLECARRLADAGHTVELWERSTRLGGLLSIGARADEVLDQFLGWLVGTAERSGAALRVGKEVTVEAAHDFDCVILATGALRPTPRVDHHSAHTPAGLAGWLSGTEALGEHIVFVGGGKISLTLAKHALDKGHRVTIIEPSGVFGPELGLPGRFRLVHDLEVAGAVFTTSVDAIDTADEIVVTNNAVSEAPLTTSLRSAGIEVHLVGDCRDLGAIEGAMSDAASLAASEFFT